MRPVLTLVFCLSLGLGTALGPGAIARAQAADVPPDEAAPGLLDRLDSAFGEYLVGPMASVLFYDLVFWDNDPPPGAPEDADTKAPFIVVWLVFGAVFFTFRFTFVNIRAFGHAIAVTRGAYDNPDDPGEVSHFQALSSALSATVGLGNIAGVAVAVGMGGPGAVFWMVVAGFFGMSSKFAECTLGQLYREVDPRGNVSGGPMRYLYKG
ncbi:MAG: alanine:cation symporter family protein, partial [Myxococcales bacterium]|nr:alanine:cation symporter family protein [Myxococcales bacterium]